jgi:hypothetical protein
MVLRRKTLRLLNTITGLILHIWGTHKKCLEHFRLCVGEVSAGLGEGEDLVLCEGGDADDRAWARVVNIDSEWACVANTKWE